LEVTLELVGHPFLRKKQYQRTFKFIHCCDFLAMYQGMASAVPKTDRPKALPLCRRQERNPKGEAANILPLLLSLLQENELAQTKNT
jgi:hypothetical protein